MTQTSLAIRAARIEDGEAVADIYAPYVLGTAVSFEEEPPTSAVMSERIGSTLPTHPWLVVERAGSVVGFTYAGKHSQRTAYRWTVDATVCIMNNERRSGLGTGLYIHALFDCGLLAFDPDTRQVVLADRLKGSNYARLAGQALRETIDPVHRPSLLSLAQQFERI